MQISSWQGGLLLSIEEIQPRVTKFAERRKVGGDRDPTPLQPLTTLPTKLSWQSTPAQCPPIIRLLSIPFSAQNQNSASRSRLSSHFRALVIDNWQCSCLQVWYSILPIERSSIEIVLLSVLLGRLAEYPVYPFYDLNELLHFSFNFWFPAKIGGQLPNWLSNGLGWANWAKWGVRILNRIEL